MKQNDHLNRTVKTESQERARKVEQARKHTQDRIDRTAQAEHRQSWNFETAYGG